MCVLGWVGGRVREKTGREGGGRGSHEYRVAFSRQFVTVCRSERSRRNTNKRQEAISLDFRLANVPTLVVTFHIKIRSCSGCGVEVNEILVINKVS